MLPFVLFVIALCVFYGLLGSRADAVSHIHGSNTGVFPYFGHCILPSQAIGTSASPPSFVKALT